MNRSAAILPAILLLAACNSSRPPWADGRMVTEERPAVGGEGQDLRRLEDRLLALHNRERRATGAAPLVWDSSLAAAAASYGPALERLGRLAHSPANQRQGQGENLWMGTRDAYELEEMAQSWAAEKSLFRPGFFPAVSRSGKWSDVAHYTQMIWKGTTRVGCAVRKSRKWDYLICRYSPPGNVVGQRVP
ncbi:MAG TPA: CAP domain-containing protein [Allosphingosinicella sp.]|nr:CAP domain-containing protein [Allosphingosinicella sp.]